MHGTRMNQKGQAMDGQTDKMIYRYGAEDKIHDD
jgi:hypothetical protein